MAARWCTLLFGAGAAAAFAQTAPSAAAPPLQIGLGMRLVATDNARADQGAARADTILELGPTLRLSRRGGVLSGALNYSGNALLYAREPADNDIVHRFAAQGSFQPRGTGFSADAQAEFTQVARNPLSARGQDTALADADRSDVATLRLQPRWQGRLGDRAELQARADASVVRARHSNADSQSLQLAISASSPEDDRRLFWRADASAQDSSFRNGTRHSSQRADATLGWSPDPDWRLSAQLGYEENDYLTLDPKGYTTGSIGVRWRPSNRTKVEWRSEHRFFGAAHSLRAEYRTPRTVWSFSDSREFTTDALGRSQAGAGAPRTMFDVLYAQFASIAPDPAQREALVDAFLQANGWTRATLAGGGFLTASASVQRYRTFSVAWNGPRNSAVLSLSGNDARRADAAATTSDALANGNQLHATAANLSLAHRLTPLASLNLDLAVSRNATSSASSRFHSAQVGLNWPLGPRQQASVTLRSAVTEATGSTRRENAATFGLRVGF